MALVAATVANKTFDYFQFVVVKYGILDADARCQAKSIELERQQEKDYVH